MTALLLVTWLLVLGLCGASQSPILDVINFIETQQPEGCDVSELSDTIAWCNGTLTKQNMLPDGTLCQSYHTETDDIICIKHKWTSLKLVEQHSVRLKRSIVDVLASVNKQCYFLCNDTVDESLLTHPPEFNYCPSSELLIPDSGLTYVVHTWTNPTASDVDGTVTSLTQIVGPAKNSSLAGSVSPGTDYVVSYMATDDDNLRSVCTFTFTSEIPVCPPVVHITNGRTMCSVLNYRGSVCNITCDNGYYLNTSASSVTCQENGDWSFAVETSQCVAVKCSGDPIETRNFTNIEFVCEQNEGNFDVICWAKCLLGYTLRNDAAEDGIIDGLQAALDDAIALHDTRSIEAQNARDAADQAVINLNTAIDLVSTSENVVTDNSNLLDQENQLLLSLEQQQSELSTNLTIAEHNLTEAVANNDPNVAELEGQVAALRSEVTTVTEALNVQRVVVDNMTIALADATSAFDAAVASMNDAELLVTANESDALAKDVLKQQAHDAMVAATAAYHDAVLHSTTDDKVITSYARCLPNGTWYIPGDPNCTDMTQPEIKCTPMVVVYLNKDETSRAVTWEIPEATDNSGSVNVVRISGIEPGTVRSAGQYPVVYQAVDNEDNRSPFCNMLINVEEYTCGYVTHLLNDTNMNYVCHGYKYGNNCTMSCDFGYDLEGQSSMTCEINSTAEGEVVPYWDWDYPSCNEVVCSLPAAPTNGQMDCTDYVEGINGTMGNSTGNSTGSSVIGITCTVICDEGFILPYQSVYVYTCENTTGWSSQNFPTTCIASGVEQDATYTLQLTYNAADSCATEDTEGFETDWVAILGQEVLSYPACIMGYACSVGGMSSQCTDGVVAVEFSVTVKCDETQDNVGCDLSVDLMSSLSDSIKISVQGGALTSVGVSLTNQWLSTISSDLPRCQDGSVLEGRYCEQCGPGYFYSTSLDSCVPCEYGSFNNMTGSLSCVACPTEMDTRITGATNYTDCIEKCSPGSYSPDGLAPCILCETGFYQDEWGTMVCKACPVGTWTTISGASSAVDCVAFDIFFVGPEPSFLLTTVGEQMSAVFWIQNLQQPDVTLGVYYSEMDSDYAFALKTEANAQLLFNGWDNEPTGVEIEPGLWVMIGITWDWATKQLVVYKNGESAYSTTLNSVMAVPDKLMLSSNAGTVVAGLSVSNRVDSGNEMLQISSDCGRSLDGATFTMDSLARLRNYNMKSIPTICAEINTTTINHCDFNACENNAVCVHNDTAGYTCNCTEEYGGPFCEELVVHGGWSEWIFSSACSTTCGNGTRGRYRLCNNPTRSNYGDDCVGNKTETVECTLEPCRECGAPGNEGGASCNLQNNTCTPTCPPGYILPNGQSGQDYTCGHTTNYEWIPAADLPVCSEIKKPKEYNCTMTFKMNRDVPCADVEAVQASLQSAANGLYCARNNAQCSIVISITGCVETGNRRRRDVSANSRLVVLITVPIVNTDPLDFTSFYIDNSVGPEVQEIIDALTAIEGTITDLQNNAGALTATYSDGNLYSVVVNDPTTDIIVVTSVACDSGQAPTSGVCAECQKGTYQIGKYCVYCERGTYQSDPSQTSCVECPAGYTTANIGARASTDCYKIPVPAVPPDYTVLIAVLVSLCLVAILVSVIFYFSRRFYLSAKYRAKYDMEADQISLYTDFPDIAYNVYFKRRQVLGFDEDGFPIISKEPVKNGDIKHYSDTEDEEEDHRTPTPLPKREPFAYPTEYLDPPCTYDPYKNLDTDILFPEEADHFFDFPVRKKTVRYTVPGRNHLQNTYPLQQFGVTGEVNSRHRKPTPKPAKIPFNKKLPQLMFRPSKEPTVEQIVKEQQKNKAQRRKLEQEYAASKHRPQGDSEEEKLETKPNPHDMKAPPTLKLHKAKESLTTAIESRSPRDNKVSPRSPKSPHFNVKKRMSKNAIKPSKRYQSILEMSSPRPTTSTSNRSLKSEPRAAKSASNQSLKSEMSSRAKSAPYDSLRSVNINTPSPRDHDNKVEEDIEHPPPSKYIVPKVNIPRLPPKSLLKNTSVFETGNDLHPATGRKSVLFQDEEVPTRPSTTATRIHDSAPASASRLARDTVVGLGSSRHKPPNRPYESDVVETYRPESKALGRPESPLYRPVSSSTRASSPTFHPKPVLHGGVTVQRRQDFIMFNPPTNLTFNKLAPSSEHTMRQMKPPPFFNRIRPNDKRSKVSPRNGSHSHMTVRFEDSDDDDAFGNSLFLTELRDSPLPSRASQTSRASSHAPPVRSRRASKVRFKKDSPPPAYQDAVRDPVIESARDEEEE